MRIAMPKKKILHGALLLLLSVPMACGGPDSRAEIDALVEAGDWTELSARVEVLRSEGAKGPWLDRAEGLALLASNSDRAALDRLERAAEAQPEYAADFAVRLAEAAQADLAEGWKDRAARRMLAAFRFDNDVELGALADPVGDLLYRYEKDFAAAEIIYRRLESELPEPGRKHGEWTYRYGYCLEKSGQVDAAMDIYEKFRNTQARDQNHLRFVQWRTMRILIERAEEARLAAQPERALELLEQSMMGGWHMDLQQEARYLAGQIEEERGELQAARKWYDMILADGSRFGGELVSKARTRLDALQALGVH